MSKKNYCITVSGTTNEEVWKEVRNITGPTPYEDYQPHIDLMNKDIAEYNQFILDYNLSVPFNKWLVWRITIGTALYGNLPKNKKYDKIGHIYAPCPYDTIPTEQSTRVWLGLEDSDPLPTKILHEVGGTHYYLRTSNRGNKWGYECTFPGCPFNIINGKNYFNV